MKTFGPAGKAARLDARVRAAMARFGMPALRWTLAVVFIWFGLLKPFDASPANELIKRTVYWLPPDFFLPVLGWWEVAIGVCLAWRPWVRAGVLLLFLQMPGTFLPLFLLPEVCFERFPFVLTMEGQYIVKNLVLIAAALVVGSWAPPLGGAEDSPRNLSAREGPGPMRGA